MGSGASTHVTSLTTSLAGKTEITRNKIISNKVDVPLREDQSEPVTNLDGASTEKLRDLEKKLWDCESEKLDLQDRVQNLEERLQEQMQQNEGEITTAVFSETLQAKDQYIAKLQEELSSVQQEKNKLKNRNKKKVKALTAQLTEVRQEGSIQMMELKDEIEQLREKNQKMREKLENKSEAEEGTSSILPDIGGSRMTLILDLSQQVSEQQEKIQKLEESLKEKSKTIKHLRSLQNPSKDLQEDDLVSTSYDNSIPVPESDFMTTGWTHVIDDTRKVKSKSKPPSGLPPVEESPLENDKRMMSLSRDSGIGSADKNGRKSLSRDKRVGSASSMLSGCIESDSDSDWGVDSPELVPCKTQSAPPGCRSPHVMSVIGESGGDNWSIDSRSGTPKIKTKTMRKTSASKSRHSESSPQRSDQLRPTLAFCERTQSDLSNTLPFAFDKDINKRRVAPATLY